MSTGELAAKARRNPAWSRDELILALGLYFEYEGRSISHGSEGVERVSEALNKLHARAGTLGSHTLRNKNGVYMKLMNFRRFDPAFSSNGTRGLQRGNKLEEEIWSDFSANRSALRAVAAGIYARLTDAH